LFPEVSIDDHQPFGRLGVLVTLFASDAVLLSFHDDLQQISLAENRPTITAHFFRFHTRYKVSDEIGGEWESPRYKVSHEVITE